MIDNEDAPPVRHDTAEPQPHHDNMGEATDSTKPQLVDESQFDDEDDDDDMPDHFGAVAHVADEPHHAQHEPADVRDEASLVPAADAEIPLDLIDRDALWVVKRLQAKGYEAYLTGGCVRDLLLGRTPKDFDVATAAHPNQVRNVFRNCRLVGRRFRLAHVFFPSGKVIETATFRQNPIDEAEDLPADLLVERDNVFGSVEEDARRRDLTVNGLFYDPLKGRVIDFVDGRKDLDARLIRTIGTPEVRFQEDPVRILRAIKFATRLGFEIEDATFRAMRSHAADLVRCAPARLQEEMLRLLTSGHAAASMALCDELGVLDAILPEIAAVRDMVLELAPVSVAMPLAISTSDASNAGVSDSAAEASTTNVVDTQETTHVEAVATPDTPHSFAFAEHVHKIAIPTSEERHFRLKRMFATLDALKERDVDMTSAVVLSTLLVPAWEAMRHSTTPFVMWFEETAQKWTDRLRLTRHDKERIPLLLEAQAELEPSQRHGHLARNVVLRPSFREALLLYTMRRHAADESLADVAMWKAVARAYNVAYKQARVSERGPRMRTASVAQPHGGAQHAGGGRGRDRGRRRRRR